MSKKDTLFTVAGITTHSGADATGTVSDRTKVRYGTDLIRLVKMLNNPKKIEDKTLGICLAPTRVDLIELPTGMLKIDALKFLVTHEQFQSPEDQALIHAEIDQRTPKIKKQRTKKDPAVITMDKIRARAAMKSASVDDVLNAFRETSTEQESNNVSA